MTRAGLGCLPRETLPQAPVCHRQDDVRKHAKDRAFNASQGDASGFGAAHHDEGMTSI